MKHVTSKKDAGILIGAVLLSLATGWVSSYLSRAGVTEWYPTIVQPWFTPPNWIFGPVWTILYILMGISLFLILKAGWDQWDVRLGTGIFAAQLFLNGMWSITFFGIPSPALGLVNIIILWFLILWMIITFTRINRIAGYMNIPYLLWVSFATILNASIYLLNP